MPKNIHELTRYTDHFQWLSNCNNFYYAPTNTFSIAVRETLKLYADEHETNITLDDLDKIVEINCYYPVEKIEDQEVITRLKNLLSNKEINQPNHILLQFISFLETWVTNQQANNDNNNDNSNTLKHYELKNIKATPTKLIETDYKTRATIANNNNNSPIITPPEKLTEERKKKLLGGIFSDQIEEKIRVTNNKKETTDYNNQIASLLMKLWDFVLPNDHILRTKQNEQQPTVIGYNDDKMGSAGISITHVGKELLKTDLWLEKYTKLEYMKLHDTYVLTVAKASNGPSIKLFPINKDKNLQLESTAVKLKSEIAHRTDVRSIDSAAKGNQVLVALPIADSDSIFDEIIDKGTQPSETGLAMQFYPSVKTRLVCFNRLTSKIIFTIDLLEQKNQTRYFDKRKRFSDVAFDQEGKNLFVLSQGTLYRLDTDFHSQNQQPQLEALLDLGDETPITMKYFENELYLVTTSGKASTIWIIKQNDILKINNIDLPEGTFDDSAEVKLFTDGLNIQLNVYDNKGGLKSKDLKVYPVKAILNEHEMSFNNLNPEIRVNLNSNKQDAPKEIEPAVEKETFSEPPPEVHANLNSNNNKSEMVDPNSPQQAQTEALQVSSNSPEIQNSNKQDAPKKIKPNIEEEIPHDDVKNNENQTAAKEVKPVVEEKTPTTSNLFSSSPPQNEEDTSSSQKMINDIVTILNNYISPFNTISFYSKNRHNHRAIQIRQALMQVGTTFNKNSEIKSLIKHILYSQIVLAGSPTDSEKMFDDARNYLAQCSDQEKSKLDSVLETRWTSYSQQKNPIQRLTSFYQAIQQCVDVLETAQKTAASQPTH